MCNDDLITVVVAPGRTLITGNGRRIEYIEQMVFGVMKPVRTVVAVPGKTHFGPGESVAVTRAEADRLAKSGHLIVQAE